MTQLNGIALVGIKQTERVNKKQETQMCPECLTLVAKSFLFCPTFTLGLVPFEKIVVKNLGLRTGLEEEFGNSEHAVILWVSVIPKERGGRLSGKTCGKCN